MSWRRIGNLELSCDSMPRFRGYAPHKFSVTPTLYRPPVYESYEFSLRVRRAYWCVVFAIAWRAKALA